MTITYWFDEEREMIYFNNGRQSSVTACGKFMWDGKFYQEDMVELSKHTGYNFKMQ